jgi:hypothetical protein
MVGGADQTYQFVTAEDFKKLLSSQGDIKLDVAVAINDLAWIIKTYNNQCKEIEGLQNKIIDLEKNYNTLLGDVKKYIGIGIGAMAVISLLISLLNLRSMLAAIGV